MKLPPWFNRDDFFYGGLATSLVATFPFAVCDLAALATSWNRYFSSLSHLWLYPLSLVIGGFVCVAWSRISVKFKLERPIDAVPVWFILMSTTLVGPTQMILTKSAATGSQAVVIGNTVALVWGFEVAVVFLAVLVFTKLVKII